MCGRYTLVRGEKILEVVGNVTIREDLRRFMEKGRFNIAPTQDVLVVLRQGASVPELTLMRWGLIPHWAKDASIASKLINARAETLAEKPSFRQALLKRRCVIPADGFYEWRKNADGSKTPMYATLKTGEGFAFAGLYETWHAPTGEEVTTCTIITTGPNELMAPIHTRMPAILLREGVQAWLDGAPRSAEELQGMLVPLEAEKMQLRAVGKEVNRAGAEGASLIEPVTDVPVAVVEKAQAKRGRKEKNTGQGSLF